MEGYKAHKHDSAHLHTGVRRVCNVDPPLLVHRYPARESKLARHCTDTPE